MWIYANPNPCRQEEPDCVVRAIAIATDQTWDDVHWDLCVMSHALCTMPSVNWLWGQYLTKCGFKKSSLPTSCPECTNVRDFTRRFPKGTYVLGTGTHAVAVQDGNHIDSWDSGDEVITFFYKKEE